MNSVFISVLNMSITASMLAIAVILLRFALKRSPRWIVCILWGFVALRLVFPFSFESIFSLMPERDPIPAESIDSPNLNSEGVMTLAPSGVIYQDPSGETVSVPAGAPTVSVETFENNSYVQLEYAPSIADILCRVWLIGISAMLLYTFASYLRLHRRVAESVLLKENIYICDSIETPFILGVFRPRIYLPSTMKEADTEYVISHECAHLRRFDHIWKPLGFLLLSMHWFNPVLWLGYILLCRDIEIACDEKVIREQGTEIKKPYSEALVNCSVPRKMISACPLAFGEVGVKERVKNVLNYKKPAFWIIIVAVIALIVTAVCFLTDPVKEEENTAVYTVSYYDAPTIEHVSPTVSKSAKILARHFEQMFKELEKAEWINDAAVDRLPYYFDGHIDTGEHQIFFAFGQKVLYCEGYFTSLSDEHSEFLQTILENNGILADSLRMQYPGFFGLDASKKLNIYVCQFAKGSYSFSVAEGGRELGTAKLMGMPLIKLDELRIILESYGAVKDDVNIVPWQNIYSSYIGDLWIKGAHETDADVEARFTAYKENIKKMIFEDIDVGDATVSVSIEFDIDGDEKKETVTFTASPYSVMTRARVFEDGKIEYASDLPMTFSSIRLEDNHTHMLLHANENIAGKAKSYFVILSETGEISLELYYSQERKYDIGINERGWYYICTSDKDIVWESAYTTSVWLDHLRLYLKCFSITSEDVNIVPFTSPHSSTFGKYSTLSASEKVSYISGIREKIFQDIDKVTIPSDNYIMFDIDGDGADELLIFSPRDLINAFGLNIVKNGIPVSDAMYKFHINAQPSIENGRLKVTSVKNGIEYVCYASYTEDGIVFLTDSEVIKPYHLEVYGREKDLYKLIEELKKDTN